MNTKLKKTLNLKHKNVVASINVFTVTYYYINDLLSPRAITV